MRQAGCLDARAVRRLPEVSASHRELSRRAACPVVPLLPAALSLPKAWALTSPRAACREAAWRRQDVHRVRHPDDHQGGVRPAPLSERPALRASVLSPRAGCRGVLPARRRALASAACARDLRRVAACPVAAVLRLAAVESASDVRGRPPAVAGSASQAPPRAARAVPVPAMASRARPRAEAVWDAREQPTAEASSGARQAARAVPEAASALPVQLRAARAGQVQQAGSASQALRPAAEQDVRVPQREVAPADAARPPAVPDVQEHPVRPVPAAPSAFRQVRFLPSAAPVRRPEAKFGRATLRWRIASPSAQSWQAARDEALSLSRSPRRKVWAGKQSENRTIRQDDEPPAVRPDCGEPRIIGEVYFDIITGCMCDCSPRVQKKRTDTFAIDVEPRRKSGSPAGESIRRRLWAGRSGRSAHR
ncbi:hypothetical protein M2222_006378 [Bradyrhizobium elkanii]|nr:hypothetical protein [Bradyrhizobium elkanii]MCS3564056.1 hypothetical protein [Bradyrhizobium elkanii]MCW2146112.1 hypothetical protein [Bradyrhizobium elkanii]MCW2354815.1 hypothetical protein [Bradyrhizobium elkanii]MCW2378939.1 hypothetical protein [Bradyrhizobium elkanii]